MKFRNPQTGKIYDFEGKERLTSGFCVGIPCKACPIRRHRGKMSCREYVLNNPNTAANLMGYEVIEGDAPTPECDSQGVAFDRAEAESVDPKKLSAEMISEIITGEELLRQTAEEAAELTQAALKIIRVARGTTPLDGETAVDMLIEEIADVQNCIAVLAERLTALRDKADKISVEKMRRWRERLIASGGTA